MKINNNFNNVYFSIIIPAYNACNYIKRTLDSVAKQTFTNFEIVITNDGSTDNTELVIMEYIKSNPSLQIFLSCQNNKGIGSARNNGIYRANGKYLAFLDADDTWYNNKLERVFEILNQFSELDVLYHDEIEIRNAKDKRISNYGIIKPPVFEDLLFNGNRLSTSATIVRTDLAKKINGFSENPDFNSAEDYEFWLRLAKNEAKFYYLPLVLGEYNRVPNSVSLRSVYHGTNCFNVIQYHINLMIEKENDINNKKNLLKSLEKLKTQNVFNTGRSSFLEKNYTQAYDYYLKAIKLRYFWWKPYAGLVQLFFRKFIFFI